MSERNETWASSAPKYNRKIQSRLLNSERIVRKKIVVRYLSELCAWMTMDFENDLALTFPRRNRETSSERSSSEVNEGSYACSREVPARARDRYGGCAWSCWAGISINRWTRRQWRSQVKGIRGINSPSPEIFKLTINMKIRGWKPREK